MLPNLWYRLLVQGTLPSPVHSVVGIGLNGMLFQGAIRFGKYTQALSIQICKYHNGIIDISDIVSIIDGIYETIHLFFFMSLQVKIGVAKVGVLGCASTSGWSTN